jgi:hypothetical protein
MPDPLTPEDALLLAPNLVGDFFTFFAFVVLCGGANAYAIVRVFRYKPEGRTVRLALILGVLMAIAAQATAPYRLAAARQHHWPKNVPATAFLVPHWSGGWYQACDFNAASNANHCRIWNFGGEVLYDEQFVLCGGGSAVRPEDLTIVDRASGPDRVTLQSGKTLIPLSRAADRNYVEHVCAY